MPKAIEKEINNIGEFMQEILSLQILNHDGLLSIQDFADKYRLSGELVYRGQYDNSDTLLPTLARPDRYTGKVPLQEERDIIQEIKRSLPDVFRDDYSPLDLLGIMQHFGAPTRLLDVTENPFVALFFACSGYGNKDGEVIVFYNERDNYLDPLVNNAIAETYAKFESHHFVSGGLGSDVFFDKSTSSACYEGERLLKQIQSHPPLIDFDESTECGHPYSESQVKDYYVAKWHSSPQIVTASTRAKRQEAQRGKYILFPNDTTENADGQTIIIPNISSIDKIGNDSDLRVCRRLIIPFAAKSSMLRELDCFGINQGSLFPENIESICKSIVFRTLLRDPRITT